MSLHSIDCLIAFDRNSNLSSLLTYDLVHIDEKSIAAVFFVLIKIVVVN